MAQLILTEEEKAAISWLDMDDDALGKLCRKACLIIPQHEDLDNPDDRKQVWASSAGMLLCGVTDDANATTAVFTFEGLTHGDKQRGNWRVTVERLDSENVRAMPPGVIEKPLP